MDICLYCLTFHIPNDSSVSCKKQNKKQNLQINKLQPILSVQFDNDDLIVKLKTSSLRPDNPSVDA